MRGWAHVVLHVDMDAFYASVEQARRPELRGQPLIIGADPLQGKGRGVVTTASYEARKFGVRSAMPISKAWQLCPQGIFLEPDFEHYWQVSERIMEVLGRSADALEVAGLDEAYLDVARRVQDMPGLEAHARCVQAAVRDAEQLSCSVGAAQGKVTAKIASDLQKPGGLTVVPPDRARDVLAPLAARRIPGIGPKTEARLAEQGLLTIAQLAELSWPRLQELFGSSAGYFRTVALGLDDSPVVPWTGPPKSVGNESTFLEDVADPERLREEVRGLARHVSGRLAGAGLRARTVSIKVRFEDFQTHTRARSVPRATREPAEVEGIALALLEPFLADGRAVRLLGVRASGLEADGGQTTLARWLPDAGP
ncbi:MAG: DNA polymerase IV [Halobacteriales archaeon]|nr:DNA polymerase IV [Halobacteriales archaeon]